MATNKTPLSMNDDFSGEDNSAYIKSFMFIKGFAVALELEQTLIALAVARKMHYGQTRKDGTPYIMHPLKVCSTLINYGVKDDATLAAALLHDVIEDCKDKLPFGGQELMTEYGVSQEVYDIITLLSKESGLDQYELSLYFDKIRKHPKAAVVKLSDRFHNSQTLYTFNHDKLLKYIKETEDFIIPMASYCKYKYPWWTNLFSILKTNIYSLNHAMNVTIGIYDKKIESLEEEITGLNDQICHMEAELLVRDEKETKREMEASAVSLEGPQTGSTKN